MSNLKVNTERLALMVRRLRAFRYTEPQIASALGLGVPRVNQLGNIAATDADFWVGFALGNTQARESETVNGRRGAFGKYIWPCCGACKSTRRLRRHGDGTGECRNCGEFWQLRDMQV